MYPVSLKIENFISHINSVIDFSKFDAALIVGFNEGNPNVANGTGKSSIFDAILFVLFGKSRFNKKEKVVKRGESVCKVEFIFSIDCCEYKVVRIFNKKTGFIEVTFYQKQNDIWVSDGFTCDTATATTHKIESIVGMNYDTFVNSIYFRQNDISGFAGSKASKRKEILKEVLQIGIWDVFQEIAKENMKGLQNSQEVVEERLLVIGDIEQTKEKEVEQLDSVVGSLQIAQQANLTMERKIENIRQDLVELKEMNDKNDVSKIQEFQNELKKIQIRKEEIKEEKNELKKEVDINNKTIVNAENDIQGLENKLALETQNIVFIEHINDSMLLPKLQNWIRQNNIKLISSKELLIKISEKDKKQNDLNILLLELQQLTSLEPGKKCPICLMENKNPKNIRKKREEKQIFLQEQIVKEQEEISKLQSNIDQLNQQINKSKESILEISHLELIVAKRMSESSIASNKNDEIRKKMKLFFNEWNELKDRHSRIENNLKSLSDFNHLQKQLKDKTKEKDDLEKDLFKGRDNMLKLSVERGHLTSKIEELSNKISEKQILLERKENILDQIKVFSKLSKAFGRNGIQSIIMENIAEDLKSHANTFLKEICSEPMSIDFNTQRQTTTGSWKEDFEIIISTNGIFVDFEDLSGGEQVRISIALRLAISRLLMQRVGSNVNFLLLDEVDQALDAHGIEVLAESIKTLAKKFKIMIITHNETMKEKFEHIITVQKGTNGSVIRQ